MPAHCFRLAAVLSLLVATALVGCGIQEAGLKAKRRRENFEDLKQLGRAFFNFHDRHQRAAKTWEEYHEVGVDAGLGNRLSAEGYTVVMGIDIRSMRIGTSNFMMAFQRSAEQEGGQVLFADGSVRVITAEEFKENLANQADNMKNAVIFEPEAPVAESGGAGVISAPANSSSSGPPLPPSPPSP